MAHMQMETLNARTLRFEHGIEHQSRTSESNIRIEHQPQQARAQEAEKVRHHAEMARFSPAEVPDDHRRDGGAQPLAQVVHQRVYAEDAPARLGRVDVEQHGADVARGDAREHPAGEDCSVSIPVFRFLAVSRTYRVSLPVGFFRQTRMGMQAQQQRREEYQIEYKT